MIARFLTPKVILAACFLIIGCVLLRETYAERVVYFTSPDELGPMVYPRYLLWGWILLSAFYLLFPQQKNSLSDIRRALPMLGAVACCIAFYIMLFGLLGLLIATFIFMLVFLYVLKYRDPKRVFIIAGATALLTWCIFEKFLGIPMPTNVLTEMLAAKLTMTLAA